MGIHTGECYFAGYFGQWRVDELFKVDLLVLDVEERLPRPQRGLAKAQRPCRIVSVQRLDLQHAQRLRDILRREDVAPGVSHEAQRFL